MRSVLKVYWSLYTCLLFLFHLIIYFRNSGLDYTGNSMDDRKTSEIMKLQEIERQAIEGNEKLNQIA